MSSRDGKKYLVMDMPKTGRLIAVSKAAGEIGECFAWISSRSRVTLSSRDIRVDIGVPAEKEVIQ